MKFVKWAAIAFAFVVVTSAITAIAQIVINPPAPNIFINGHTYTNQDWQNNPGGTLSAIANDIGQITTLYPQGRFSPRVSFSSNLTFFVDPGGNDANNCLVGNPCKTVQRVLDLLRDGYDLRGFIATIQLADGSYSRFSLSTKFVGQQNPGNLVLRGNPGAPSNVIITDATVPTSDQIALGVGTPAQVQFGGQMTIDGVKFIAGYRDVWADTGSHMSLKNVVFGKAQDSQVVVAQGSRVQITGDYSIVDGGLAHFASFTGGLIGVAPAVTSHVTITNTPAFTIAFAVAQKLGQISTSSAALQFTGGTTGARFLVDTNAVISTNGAGTSFYPGSLAGVAQLGGIYQ